jgi:ceroid-lipofuscinosis neuronal protein 5
MHLVFETLELVKVSISKFDFLEKLNIIFFNLIDWTMEWYELDQLFNCTFPHVLDDDSFKWCNQGALCVYDGIDDKTWTQYGILEKVSSISGDVFNKFGAWALNDNNTNVFYETWSVYNTADITDKSLTMYFDSFDCASWVLRAFDAIYELGGRFDEKITLNYTRLNIYSYEPVKIGTYDDIINSKNQTLIDDIRKFYRDFQKPKTNFLQQFLDIFNYIEVSKTFYFYYNELYWLLPIKSPSIKVTYYPIPLPGTKLN